MGAETNLVDLIFHASLVVQLVLVLLLLISVASWTAIFKKRMALRYARGQADTFEDNFWSGVDLKELYTRIRRDDADAFGLEAIFLAGFQEFLRLRRRGIMDAVILAGSAQRAMRAALAREVDELDTHLPMLATVGSTSPYIGLFGTVWGIMSAFHALGGVQQVTLGQVAPGIAEALIATAMGLLAAIPAVVAYNRSSTEVERLVSRYETFMDEFVNILQRQAQPPRPAVAGGYSEASEQIA